MATAELLDLVVAARTPLAEGIALFELRRPDGAALPPFEAGSHIELQLQHEGRSVARPYSLCNAPGETHRWQIAVLRVPESRGGSAAVHDTLQPGTRLRAKPPRNLFPLQPGAQHSLLLAGGIGITPLLAMAEVLHAAGRPFTLHHATRHAARTPFVERLALAPWHHQVRRHFDDGVPAQRLDIAAVLAASASAAADAQLYVCGPQGFMDAVLKAARAQGWPEDRLHWESFGAEPAPPAITPAGSPPARPFTLVLAQSGITVKVPSDSSAAAAILAAGVFLPTSCERGVCGTCLTPVLQGRPEHHDQYLTPEEQAAGDQFTPCCSRALDEQLVIDL